MKIMSQNRLSSEAYLKNASEINVKFYKKFFLDLVNLQVFQTMSSVIGMSGIIRIIKICNNELRENCFTVFSKERDLMK